MKRTFAMFIGFISLGAAVFVSCKKNGSAPGGDYKSSIVGTWRETKVVLDTDANGIADAGDEARTGMTDFVLIFNANGTAISVDTGSSHTPHGTYPFADTFYYNWAIVNNSYLKMTPTGTDTGYAINIGLPSLEHIDSVNGTELAIRDTCSGCYWYGSGSNYSSNSSLRWLFFKKE